MRWLNESVGDFKPEPMPRRIGSMSECILSTMTPAQLKESRETLGLSQIALARALEISQGHLSKMESGRKPIREVYALAMLQLLSQRGE